MFNWKWTESKKKTTDSKIKLREESGIVDTWISCVKGLLHESKADRAETRLEFRCRQQQFRWLTRSFATKIRRGRFNTAILKMKTKCHANYLFTNDPTGEPGQLINTDIQEMVRIYRIVSRINLAIFISQPWIMRNIRAVMYDVYDFTTQKRSKLK